MSDFNQNYSGATTTANSADEGRLKVDASNKNKKKLLKLILRKHETNKEKYN